MRKSHSTSVLRKKNILRKQIKTQLKKNIFQRYFRYLHLRLLRLRDTPEKIAKGLAIGVFAGFFPFFGVQTILAILFAILFKANKIAAATATWISNPLTYVPIFAFNFKIGQLIIGGDDFAFDQLNFQSTTEILELGAIFAITLLLGCLIIGSIASFFTYFLSLRLLKKLRKYN
jgi:uncharacterized protein (DUF2062 family)